MSKTRSTTPKNTKPRLSPDALFEYAKAFALGNQDSPGKRESIYPTLREAASYFGTTMSRIEDACANYVGKGYMKPAVGFQTHAGHGRYATKGDWLVEAYD